MIDESKNKPLKNYSEILASQRRDKYLTMLISVFCSLLFFALAWNAVNDRKRGAYFVGRGVSGYGEYVSYNKPEYRKVEVEDYLKKYTSLMYAFDANSFKGNLEQALALGGVTGPAAVQVQVYKDNGYYESLVSGNSRIQVSVDSIQSDVSTMPYRANVFATQTTFSGAGSQRFKLWFYVELDNLDSRSPENIYGLTLKTLTPFDQNQIVSENN